MSRPNVNNDDIREAMNRSEPGLWVIETVQRVLQDLRHDVSELIPKYGTSGPGDPLELAHAHLTMAIAALEVKQ